MIHCPSGCRRYCDFLSLLRYLCKAARHAAHAFGPGLGCLGHLCFDIRWLLAGFLSDPQANLVVVAISAIVVACKYTRHLFIFLPCSIYVACTTSMMHLSNSLSSWGVHLFLILIWHMVACRNSLIEMSHSPSRW
jgi:hypothetical protein